MLMPVAALLVMTLAAPALAQPALTIADAMARARRDAPAAQALRAGVEEAAARVTQARAAYFPRVEFRGQLQRGNEPVFAFGSLLAQRRFRAENFAIDALNFPAPVTNTRTILSIEQPLYSGGRTRAAVRGAELARTLAEIGLDDGEQALTLAAAEAFVAVLEREALMQARQAAVAAADADCQRAAARREAGIATLADVLAADVHAAAMRREQITVAADLAVARLQLNEVIGAPLHEELQLARPTAPAVMPAMSILVGDARRRRPDRRGADVQVALAVSAQQEARAAFLPQLSAHGTWALDGATIADQRSSWAVGAELQLNLFRGFADHGRASEVRQRLMRAVAERERIDRRIEVEIRAAAARLEAARAAELVGRTALAQAREAQRVVRDRYDSGLAQFADVLRAAEAVVAAESAAVAADLDVVIAAIALDRAAGRL